jgi:hypothetical protein
MEANNDSPKTQTSGDIGIDGIMELDQGPMAKDDYSNRDNLKIVTRVQCAMTLYLYLLFHLTTWSPHSNRDIRHSLLSGSMIVSAICVPSPFAHSPHPFGPCIWPDPQPTYTHCFNCAVTYDIFKHQACSHQYGRYYHFYNESPYDYCFTDEDLCLTTDESNFDEYKFDNDLEELKNPADPSMMDNDSISDMHLPTSQR